MKLRAFSKSYDGRCVLRWPEFSLEPGKRYAIIGANGSGKSTLARCMAGVIRPDEGDMVLQGVKCGYMPQKNYAFRMSVARNLTVSSGTQERTEELMGALGLVPLRQANAKTLSGGETARLALGRVLMGDYDILLLDEPTAAMDMASTLIAERLIADYCRERGSTMILITHSLQQARRMADEVLFLDGGELVERGSVDVVLTAPQDARTKAFLDFYGLG